MCKIEQPDRHLENPFLFSIDGTHNIAGRGTVVTGTIDQGKIKPGENIEIMGGKLKVPIPTTVTSVETFQKSLEYGEAGDNVGLLLRGIKMDQVKRGMLLAKPKTFKTHTKFKAQCYVLNKDEGGRHKGFFTGYTPQMFIRTNDQTCKISIPGDSPDEKKCVLPGDNLELEFQLQTPLVIDKGMRFALREGGKTVAAGLITTVLE
mmetsp:Transcript_77699/g.168049  ORF Transcript_77699/g.168049 Transcript_77699/m.168049 type:complete len:205 (+) Transcript_77699:638-1252(+)